MNCPLCNSLLKEGNCPLEVDSEDIDFASHFHGLNSIITKIETTPHYMIKISDICWESFEKFKLFDLTFINASEVSQKLYCRIFINTNLVADLNFHIKPSNIYLLSREDIFNKIKAYQIFS